MPEVLTEAILSGRDLDAAVAERVLGWTIAPEGERWRVSATGEYGNSWCVDSPRLADLDNDVDDRLYGRYAMPSYSESIEAAMQVVEKMREQGRSVEILAHTDAFTVAIYTFSADLAQVDHHTDRYVSKSLPEAICLAALKAVESK